MPPSLGITHDEDAGVRRYLEEFEGRLLIRMAIFGQEGVGKSNIITRLWNDAFVGDTFDPTGSEIFDMVAHIGHHMVKCEGETASPTQRSSTAEWPPDWISGYTVGRHCEACVFVYGAGDRSSFDAIQWYRRNFLLERTLQTPANCAFQCSPACPPRPPYRGRNFVIANKNDGDAGERTVTSQEGEEYAVSMGAAYIEVSAKTGEGVGTELLSSIVAQILLNRLGNMQLSDDPQSHAAVGYTLPDVSSIARHKNKRFWY